LNYICGLNNGEGYELTSRVYGRYCCYWATTLLNDPVAMFLALEGGFFDVCDIMPDWSFAAADRFEFYKLCGDLSKKPAVLVLLLLAVLLVLFD